MSSWPSDVLLEAHPVRLPVDHSMHKARQAEDECCMRWALPELLLCSLSFPEPHGAQTLLSQYLPLWHKRQPNQSILQSACRCRGLHRIELVRGRLWRHRVPLPESSPAPGGPLPPFAAGKTNSPRTHCLRRPTCQSARGDLRASRQCTASIPTCCLPPSRSAPGSPFLLLPARPAPFSPAQDDSKSWKCDITPRYATLLFQSRGE
mmetsp:Transcript_44980/g.91817  ORF Transcript_44980/g.91817 Transcript_44980/m.91817 type:complete len:206 (+) Transcript_44980:286-903(+)